jgi:hypothetical protein
MAEGLNLSELVLPLKYAQWISITFGIVDLYQVVKQLNSGACQYVIAFTLNEVIHLTLLMFLKNSPSQKQ